MLLAILFSIWGHVVVLGLFFLLAPSLLGIHRPPSAAELKRLQQLRQAQAQKQQPQLMFVQVDPSQAVAEAPKNAKYYSTQNTKAANLTANADTDTPKIDGSQIHVPKTEDTPRSKMSPLQPSVPKEPTPEPAKPQPDPAKPPPEPAKPQTEPQSKPGDLAMAKLPETKPDAKPETKPDPAEEHRRPLRLSEVQQDKLVGQKIKQDGGVRPHTANSFDAVGSEFGEYDARIINAIQMRWYDLIDNENVYLRTGRVELEFRLNYDGRITDMNCVYSDVSEAQKLMCEKAVTDPQPYDRWPLEMRRTVGADFRDVHFTFYY